MRYYWYRHQPSWTTMSWLISSHAAVWDIGLDPFSRPMWPEILRILGHQPSHSWGAQLPSSHWPIPICLLNMAQLRLFRLGLRVWKFGLHWARPDGALLRAPRSVQSHGRHGRGSGRRSSAAVSKSSLKHYKNYIPSLYNHLSSSPEGSGLGREAICKIISGYHLL